MHAIMRIQEAADQLGVSPHTLRRYEQRGVIPRRGGILEEEATARATLGRLCLPRAETQLR